jgi:hypothetical protein
MNENIWRALKVISDNLFSSKVEWCLVGTSNLALQGIDVEIKDIDIITDKEGVYEANKILKKYEVTNVWFKNIENKISVYSSRYEINGVEVNIMGDIKMFCKDKKWTSPKKALINKKIISYNGKKLYIVPLDFQLETYKKIGREQDNEKIKKIEKFLSKI